MMMMMMAMMMGELIGLHGDVGSIPVYKLLHLIFRRRRRRLLHSSRRRSSSSSIYAYIYRVAQKTCTFPFA